ncbi:Fc receptor-like protein 5 [Silurus meridionalis]|uniref:Fc receptor-like protein 5 n=1 Tax=Silurus meridionalis TaxID=175797 RepID=UPI001EEBF750|nr:Fc receptor-like protein 5 [Silurus meridionalis]
MELSPLPVILLLISVLLVAQAQGTHKAVVSIKPDRHVFIRETVILRCEVQVNGSQLTYSWYKNTKSFTGEGIDVAIDNIMPNLIIWSVKHSESGNYTCRGERKDSQSSEISNAVTLIVSGKSKPTLRVNPQSLVYTGDTVTLICELQQGTGWEFQWYKKTENLQQQNTEHSNILKVTAENAGETVYQCRARRIHYKSKYYHTDLSDPVSITAKERPQAVLSVSPQNWLTEGDSVTLSCEVTDSSTDWTFSWYTVVPYRDGLSPAHIVAILTALRKVREGRPLTVEQFQTLLGLMAAASSAIPLGPLYMRPLQWWLRTREFSWGGNPLRTIKVTRAKPTCLRCLERSPAPISRPCAGSPRSSLS